MLVTLAAGLVLAQTMPLPPPPPPAPAPTAQPASPTAPLDVLLVRDVFSAVAEAGRAERPDLSRLREALVRTVETQCDALLRESGIRDLVAVDRSDLSARIAERVDAEGRAAVSAPAATRRQALSDLGRRVTARKLAEAILARWLGFPEDGPERPRNDRPDNIGAQLITSPGPGDVLRLVPASSRLLAEVGGPGEGNGFLDAGEWVKVQLGVENPTGRPWFSTTAFPRAESSCVFVEPDGVVLPELAPAGSSGVFELWVYVGRDCAGGSRRLIISVRDTLRAPRTAIELAVALNPIEAPAPRVLRGRFDTDELGSSDGRLRPDVVPDERFEYSADVSVPGVAAFEVRTGYSTPADLGRLFTGWSYRDEPLVPDADRIFRAADDVDATVVGPAPYARVLEGAGLSHRWVNRANPRLWLAVDTSLQVARPGPAPKAATPAPAQRTPEPLAPEAVAGLVAGHLKLETHPAQPLLPGAVAATTGVEAVFDAKGFMTAYRKLVWPDPEPAAPGTVLTAPAAPAPVSYRIRQYQGLALAPAALRAPAPAPSPAAPPPPPIAAAPEEPYEPGFVTVDLGAAWTGYSATAAAHPELALAASTVDVASFRARISFGRSFGPYVGLSVGKDGQWKGETNYRETDLEAGLSFTAHAASLLDVRPWLGLFYESRNLLATGQQTHVGFAFGVRTELRLHAQFGLHVDAGMKLGSSATPELSSQGFPLGGGLTFHF